MNTKEKPWQPGERVRVDPDTWEMTVNPSLLQKLVNGANTSKFDRAMEVVKPKEQCEK